MDMPLIADYIEQVVHRVKFIPARVRVREELTMHFEDLMEQMVRTGLSEEEAQQQSIIQMGNPKELGRQFNQAHDPVIEYSRLIARKAASIWIPIFLFGAGGLILCSYENYSEPEARDYITGEVVSVQKLTEYITLEDSTYRFSKAVYDSDSNLYLFYHKAGFNVVKNQDNRADKCRFYDLAGDCYGDEAGETDYYDGVMIVHDVDKDSSKLTIEYQGYQTKDFATLQFPDEFFEGK